jgi:hypothetical protein
MGMGLTSLPMEISILGSMSLEIRMDMGSISGVMEICILGGLRKDRRVGRGSGRRELRMKMENQISMKENMREIKNMGLESSNGKVETNLEEFMLMMFVKDMVKCSGLMVPSTEVTGLTVSRMA